MFLKIFVDVRRLSCVFGSCASIQTREYVFVFEFWGPLCRCVALRLRKAVSEIMFPTGGWKHMLTKMHHVVRLVCVCEDSVGPKIDHVDLS